MGAVISISKYLDEDLVVFLKKESRDQVLKKLVDTLVASGKVSANSNFYQAILKREEIVSTGIGSGVAIPHAKLESLQDFSIAIGIEKDGDGLDWSAIDGYPVRLVFLIGGPASNQAEYLKILSYLTAKIKHQDLRENLLKCKSRTEVLSFFK